MQLYLSSFAPRYIGAGSYEEVAPLLKDMRVLVPYSPFNNKEYEPILQNKALFKSVMLDSGAFAYKNVLGDPYAALYRAATTDWNKRIKEYTKVINTYNIDLFFELDVEVLVGLDRVKEFRRKIEALTGKQCIPVWSPQRGMEDFEETISNYKYIALQAGNFAKAEYMLSLLPLINKAHEKGCKVHGLGVGIRAINRQLSSYNVQVPFDSIDFTSWINGAKYGVVHKFTGDRFVNQYYRGRQGQGNNFYQKINLLNLKEFINAGKYLETKD